jgi:hypothetical protein
MPSNHSSSSHCGSSGGSSYSGGSSFSGGGSHSGGSSFSGSESHSGGSSFSSGDSYSGGGSYSHNRDYDDYRDYRDYRGSSRPPDEDMYMTVRRTNPKIKASKPAKGYYSFRCICCKDHDYRLFESDWKDKKGELHKAGWYDEFNDRYDAAALAGSLGATCICGNCGQSSTLSLEGNYQCPNCGGFLNVAIDTEDKVKQLSSIGKDYFYSDGLGGKLIGVIIFLLSAIILLACMGEIEIPDISAQKEITQEENQESELWLKYIGKGQYEHLSTKKYHPDKILIWDGENYHDTELDYYIWYNEDYRQYQYWYEPISGDYGDYGWMEYDKSDGKWYIEMDKDDWNPLPDRCDTSKLYYIIN